MVGAGSAGAPLAARLSQDPSRRVLLLEAGPDLHGPDRPASLDESNVYGMIADGRYFWDGLQARVTDEREPQRYLAGRITGGGSSINGQAAVRPLPEDLDLWAASGCEGWSARELLPVLERMECDLDFGGWGGHGKDGPIPVSRPSRDVWGPVDLALEQAAADAGFERIPDINAPCALGISGFPVNRRGDRRYSTALAYLDAARSRPNLTIAGNALALRVHVERGRVRGVDAVVEGERRRLAADLIVLSAGVLLTPAILMRSGIGPAVALSALGIEPAADLPVGRHLLEHPNAAVVLDLLADARLPSPEGCGSNCCIRYDSEQPGCPQGDMWIWSNGSVGHHGPGLERGMLGVSVFGSFSEGSVELANADPATPPRVRLRLLSDERDRLRLADGLARLLELATNAAFREIAWPSSSPKPPPTRPGEPHDRLPLRASDAPPDFVFDALADAERIAAWWPSRARFEPPEPQPGGRLIHELGTMELQLELLRLHRPYGVSWQCTGGLPAEFAGTRVRFELVPHPRGTLLRFVHEGFAAVPRSLHWHIYLERLRQLCEQGGVHPLRSNILRDEALALNFEFAVSAEALYDAIAHRPDQWWTERCRVAHARGGETVMWHYPGDVHRFRVLSLESARRIEWFCHSANHEEWRDTTLHFEIESRARGESALRFRHIGMSPRCACYEEIQRSWSFILGRSLRGYLEKGRGELELMRSRVQERRAA